MGEKGGRPRLPNHLKVLRGEKRPSRMNQDEPAGPTGAPPMPDWISARSAQHWDRLRPQLLAMGTLARCDDGVLTVYCESLALLEYASEKLREAGENGEGYLSVTNGGYESPSAWFTIRSKAIEQLLKAASHLGLTASARSSIRATPEGKPKPASPYDEFRRA